MVLLEQGEVVPADMRLTKSRVLQVNEAALTGESVPVTKTEETLTDASDDLPPADQSNMAFMGTAVTSGSGEGVVVATGEETELGQIAEQIRGAGDVTTPLQQRMDRMAKWIAAIIVNELHKWLRPRQFPSDANNRAEESDCNEPRDSSPPLKQQLRDIQQEVQQNRQSIEELKSSSQGHEP